MIRGHEPQANLEERIRLIEERIRHLHDVPMSSLQDADWHEWREQLVKTEAGFERWKSLPEDIRNSADLNEFESALDQTLRHFGVRDESIRA